METSATKYQPAVILLVEDDPSDQILTREAFQSLTVPHELRVVSDGKEALDYLYRRGAYESSPAPRPDLILLDLNLPRINGHQVAEAIHADAQLSNIPIVVLTTSRRQEDVLRAYGRGITCFISKPLDFQHFVATAQELERLIKLMLALKSLRDSTRITDRQVRRLARKQRQLEHLADELFEHHMSQIETVLSGHRSDNEPDDSAWGFDAGRTETSTREDLARLAGRILQGMAHEPPAAESDREPAARPAPEPARGWQQGRDSSHDLCQLARCLEALNGISEAQPPVLAKAQPSRKKT